MGHHRQKVKRALFFVGHGVFCVWQGCLTAGSNFITARVSFRPCANQLGPQNCCHICSLHHLTFSLGTRQYDMDLPSVMATIPERRTCENDATNNLFPFSGTAACSLRRFVYVHFTRINSFSAAAASPRSQFLFPGGQLASQ